MANAEAELPFPSEEYSPDKEGSVIDLHGSSKEFDEPTEEARVARLVDFEAELDKTSTNPGAEVQNGEEDSDEQPSENNPSEIYRRDLPPIDEVLQNLKQRDPADILNNELSRPIIWGALDSGKIIDYRTRAIGTLRFGIPARGLKSFSRDGRYVKIEEIIERVPDFHQGLDVESTSMMLGFKPEVILETEIDFLKQLLRIGPDAKNIPKEIYAERKKNRDMSLRSLITKAENELDRIERQRS